VLTLSPALIRKSKSRSVILPRGLQIEINSVVLRLTTVTTQTVVNRNYRKSDIGSAYYRLNSNQDNRSEFFHLKM
jgi:hypothetical protein